MSGKSILALYLFYGVMAGLGIGAAFNVIISTVNGWFPDKRGLCSGVLMMGFGTSALVIGKIASALIDGPGWRTAYAAIGISLAVMLTIAALMLKPNDAPAPQRQETKDSSVRDYTTKEMLRRNSFWLGFLFVVCIGAVGGTVLSFARDLALSIGAEPDTATTLVGVLSVSNGFGRILYGTLFDRAGRRATMIFASVTAIGAALVMLAGVSTVSLPLLTAGICLAGTSYGSCPTISSAFISSFYGTKYFPLNFSVMNFSLIPGSAIATVAGKMVESTGGFTAPIILLAGFAVISLVLNFCIRRP
jgi:OFA family oxalate/formate antiporter-like MFS transporter